MSSGPAIASRAPSTEISNPQAVDLLDRDRGEARVGAAGGDRRARDDVGDGIFGLDVADAPAQLASPAKGDERAGPASQFAVDRNLRASAGADVREDGAARQRQQTAAGGGVHQAATSLRSPIGPNAPNAAAT